MTRASYLLKRAGLSVVTFLVVATVLFLLFRLIPGDPSTAVVSPRMSAETRQILIRQYGLDEPLYVQYLDYMRNVLTGNLGRSFTRGKPVLDIVLDRALNTVALMLTSILLAFVVGPVIGAYLAWNRGSRADTLGVGLVLVAYAAPVFWTGMLAIMVFSFQLGWLPSGGMHSATYVSDSLVDRFVSVDFLWHLILPATVTTLYWLSIPTLTMRNNMLDVLSEDFVTLNRAQGLSEAAIVYRHAARNALLPVLHYAAVAIGFAFGGSVIIETVFSWPGIGRLMWRAVLAQDFPLAQGSFLFLATIVIVMNFVVDVISGVVDPRATMEGSP